jgi:hypothetical protein
LRARIRHLPPQRLLGGTRLGAARRQSGAAAGKARECAGRLDAVDTGQRNVHQTTSCSLPDRFDRPLAAADKAATWPSSRSSALAMRP